MAGHARNFVNSGRAENRPRAGTRPISSHAAADASAACRRRDVQLFGGLSESRNDRNGGACQVIALNRRQRACSSLNRVVDYTPEYVGHALQKNIKGGTPMTSLEGCRSPARADDVTPERLLNADKEAGNWLHHHKNFSATRFSSLNEINRGNVKNLKVAWTMHLGGVEGGGIWTHGGLEGTPIVENGFMYVTDGWGSVYKIDTHGGQGTLLWKMDPKTDHDWAGAVACCGVDNRGVALWGNLGISHTLDGRLVATNKDNSQVAWQRQAANADKGEVITGAPLIVKNMAITGVAGAEYGIRGWFAATDLATQKQAWRTFPIPGKGEPGHDTWKDDKNSAASGGGSAWVTGSHDPATHPIIWGVGNPSPA